MNVAHLEALANHLWQSTIFAVAVGFLTVLLKRNSAQSRYWLWFAASAKFLVPLSLFVWAGSQVTAPALPAPSTNLSVAVGQATEPFELGVETTATTPSWLPRIMTAFWVTGFGLILISGWLKRRRIQSAIRTATAIDLPVGIKALSSPAFHEPGVFGVRHPVLLVPSEITTALSARQLEAVLAHELCHVRRRDNLLSIVHMAVEAAFWFHPLVWWVGSQLIEERERACDEEVVRSGIERETYAAGILKICELYLEAQAPWVTGIGGGSLRRRIEEIMVRPSAQALGAAKKLTLIAAGIAVIALPLLVGILSRVAQAEQFEVASVRPSPPITPATPVYFGPPRGGPGTSDPERITWTYTTVKAILMQAYGVKSYQVTGPAWLGNDKFDIAVKVSPGTTQGQVSRMWQHLLAERFGVALHHETKEFNVENLVIGKGGHKLKRSTNEEPIPDGPPAMDKSGTLIRPGMVNRMTNGPGGMSVRSMARAQPLAQLTMLLGNQLNKPVLDKTGLTGKFDFEFVFTPDASLIPPPPGQPPVPHESGSNLAFAIQEQLGLRLVSGKADIDLIVVDQASKVPTEN